MPTRIGIVKAMPGVLGPQRAGGSRDPEWNTDSGLAALERLIRNPHGTEKGWGFGLLTRALARDGLSHPKIGGRLFSSARTVEWRLRKVFAELNISSRKQLRSVLPDSEGGPDEVN